MKRAALYARVSTGGQTVENQLRELEAVASRLGWEIVERFVDEGISGAKGRAERPALDRMLKAVIRGEVDVVAAWSVDRLGRSLQELIGILDELRERDVDLYLHRFDPPEARSEWSPSTGATGSFGSSAWTGGTTRWGPATRLDSPVIWGMSQDFCLQ